MKPRMSWMASSVGSPMSVHWLLPAEEPAELIAAGILSGRPEISRMMVA